MRYLQYGQIKTTNRQFQTFRDLKSERSDRSRIGHESVSFCDLSCLRSQTLYKKTPTIFDIVGVVVHLLSIAVQRFCDPLGARTQDPNIKSVVLYLLS